MRKILISINQINSKIKKKKKKQKQKQKNKLYQFK